jgi:hypothetical protein
VDSTREENAITEVAMNKRRPCMILQVHVTAVVVEDIDPAKWFIAKRIPALIHNHRLGKYPDPGTTARLCLVGMFK